MRTIKLMADYQCYPLWEATPGIVGNINPASLPISQNLVNRLNAWAHKYDATLSQDDPASSGFASEQARDDFKKEGGLLALDLQEELGAEYLIKARI
jgi:hypothetical protein